MANKMSKIGTDVGAEGVSLFEVKKPIFIRRNIN